METCGDFIGSQGTFTRSHIENNGWRCNFAHLHGQICGHDDVHEDFDKMSLFSLDFFSSVF